MSNSSFLQSKTKVPTSKHNLLFSTKSKISKNVLRFLASLVISVATILETPGLTILNNLGLNNAVKKGIKLGRPIVTKKTLENDPMFLKYYLQYKAGTINLSEMARLWGKCRNTCYNNIHIYEKLT